MDRCLLKRLTNRRIDRSQSWATHHLVCHTQGRSKPVQRNTILNSKYRTKAIHKKLNLLIVKQEHNGHGVSDLDRLGLLLQDT
jgi:hypothetical protein